MRRLASELGWGLVGLALSPFFIFRYAAWFARSWWVGRRLYSTLGFIVGEQREGFTLESIDIDWVRTPDDIEMDVVNMKWVKK